MLVTLNEILKEKKTVAAFNVYGYEDAAAVIRGAEELECPVILMTNKDAVSFIPIEVIGPMLVHMAEVSMVPVCVHLDHSRSLEDIERAIAAGYTSVMFDGSQLPVEENISISKEVVRLAHEAGVSVEAEIGSVGYSDPSIQAKSIYTDPAEAAEFAEKTGVDALAVAVGTVHRMEIQEARLDFALLEEIRSRVKLPLVIHGSSGVKDDDIVRLCEAGVNKINFGTSLRMAFGNTLRQTMAAQPKQFDRLKLFVPSMEAVAERAKDKMRLTGAQQK